MVSRSKLERIYKVDAMLLGAQISVKKLLETDEKGIFKLTDLHQQVRLEITLVQGSPHFTRILEIE